MAEPVQARKRDIREDFNHFLDQVLNSKSFSPTQIQQFYDEGIRSRERQAQQIAETMPRQVPVQQQRPLNVVVRRIEAPRISGPMTPEAVRASVNLAQGMEQGNIDFERWRREGGATRRSERGSA